MGGAVHCGLREAWCWPRLAPNLPGDLGTSPPPSLLFLTCGWSWGWGPDHLPVPLWLCWSLVLVSQGSAPNAMIAHAGHMCQVDEHTKAVWLLRGLRSETPRCPELGTAHATQR